MKQNNPMEKELKAFIREKENDLRKHQEVRDALRNKIRFCEQHKFYEEVRIANDKLSVLDGIVYEFQQMLTDLKIIVKSYDVTEADA